MRHAIRSILCAALATLLLQAHAQAWGPTAHDAIGLIAESLLTAKAKTRVKELASDTSLGELGLWGDNARRTPEWAHTKGYHFANVPDQMNYFTALKAGLAAEVVRQGDVFMATLKAEETLRSPQASKEEKSLALAFLTHFLADLHQPLHTGRPEDKGGNDIPIAWPGGRQTNLHQAWDSAMIETHYGPLFAGKPKNQRGALYARTLLKERPAEMRSWLKGYVDTWFEESLALRPFAYQGAGRDPKELTQASIREVNRRVLQAGLRLAALLNDVFDPSSTARRYQAPAAELKAKLKQALGASPFLGVSLLPVLNGTTPQSFFKPVAFYTPAVEPEKGVWDDVDCGHEH